MKPLRKILKGGKAAAGPLLAGLRPTTASNKTIDNFTQPCLNCRATLRSESGFPFIGRTSSSILRPLRSDGPECSRDTATGRAWHVLPAGMWACGNRLDSDLGPTFSMPGLRPYYELIAGLAPSRALVCRDGHYRSSIPTLHSPGTRPLYWRQVWAACGCHGMAKSPKMEKATSNISDFVGLAGFPTGGYQACVQ